MIGNQFRYSELPKSRYKVTASINGIKLDLKETSQGPIWVLKMNIIYQKLADELREQLCADENASGVQQFRNHLTTLTGFLIAIGKDENSRVGRELKSSFFVSVNTYLDMLNVSERTKADRRSHLNKWKIIAELVESKERGTANPLKSFNTALKESLIATNMSKAAFINSTGISKSVLSKWLCGAQPNQRSVAAIHRAENVLKLERGKLTNLIRASSTQDKTKVAVEIGFRKRLSESQKTPFILKSHEISDSLLNEWKDLFRYKTSVIVKLKRRDNAVWRLKPVEKCSVLSAEASIGKLASPSADMMWKLILKFLGFLRLPTSQEGYGLELHEVQTISWLAHADALNAFLEFVKSRSGGICHSTHKIMCVHVIGLLNPVTGYLGQQSKFMSKLSKNFLPSDLSWLEICDETTDVAKMWKKKANDQSRSPVEPIAALLALPYALGPIFRAIKQLDMEAYGMPSGGVIQACLKRDALLLSLLISNPLRVINLKIMTWSPDNAGNLYKDGDKSWRIRFNSNEIKTDKPYNVKVASWLVNRLEAYIEEYRDTILGSRDSKVLFVSSRESEAVKWEHLDVRVKVITKRLIPETPGFGAHAFRHLVATDWLTKNPNDFLTVAELLNDRIETVIKHYAHLKKDQSFDRYENYVLGVMGDNMSK